MIILRADKMGFCFGVRDAITEALELENPQDITIHGELVHNESVLSRLRDRGYQITDESHRQDLSDRPELLITAHGISDRERRRLQDSGKRLVDTTCPLVASAHQVALNFRDEGRLVVVIGRRGHIEVEGLIGDLDRYRVYATPAEVEALAYDRIGVLSQTTTRDLDFELVLQAIRDKNSRADIAVNNTICAPTRARQIALDKLIAEVEFLVVVGGVNSNNSNQLVALARRAGCPAHRVSGPEDIRAEWFWGRERIGLTAGTSTPDNLIKGVEDAILRLPGLN